MYYLQKMLTQHAREKKDSLKISIESLRRCMGMAPDFEADFKLFGRVQTRREVRLKLIEALAFANQQTQAYALLSEYDFAPISPVSGSTAYQDFAWHHMHGFVLATMGKLNKAAEVLNKFKIVAPQDYANVDEALWILEGVYDKLYQLTDEPKWQMEARIVAALQNKLKGPFSKEKYSTAAHLFPRTLPGDEKFFSAVIDFYDGNFEKALEELETIRNRGIMSSHNRVSSQLLRIEAMLYSGKQITDDVLEELLRLADSRNLTTLQREKVGFLLARYILDEDKNFSQRRLDHEGQTFVKSICSKPWVLTIGYQRGEVKRVKEPLRFRDRDKEEQKEVEREPSSLICELYANRPNDWVVSANLYLFEIPQLSLLGEGRTVGREKEGQGWIFKDKQIDALRRRHQYLAVFEFDNSDSEKSLQGVLFKP
jgi:tetratricopeptide (TPR) repeat protein